MRRFTEREEVKSVAARWKDTYFVKGVWRYGLDKAAIYNKLAALDTEAATAADVANIIGNKSWVEPKSCTECQRQDWGVVEVGDPPDYESCTAYLCKDCLRLALALSEMNE